MWLGIIEALSEMFLAGLMNEDGAIDGGQQAQTRRIIPDGRTFYVIYDASADDGPTITVTQNDVRAIQMAKAALYAGYRLLKDKLEADGDMRPVERVYLAGAFGSRIDVKHAMVLGMIPIATLPMLPRSATRRDGRAHCSAQRPGAPGYRGGRAQHREDRDRR